MTDPCRSKCTECDVLRQTILAREHEFAKKVAELRERLTDAQDDRKHRVGDVTFAILPFVTAAALIAGLVWFLAPHGAPMACQSQRSSGPMSRPS